VRIVIIILVCGFCTISMRALEPKLRVFVDNPWRPVVMGTTNLPDGTELMISISRTHSDYHAQDKTTVSGGHFKSVQFSQAGGDLNPGTYRIELIMPRSIVQPQEVQNVIGHTGEHLTGPLVRRAGILGATVESTTTFTVGAASNKKLDTQARAARAKERARWIAESCNSSIDMVNTLVRQGKASGHEIIGAEREAHIAACIKEVSSGKDK
jgi:hypothetical protein